METALPKISHQKHLALIKNYEAAASLAKLIYVSDMDAGIIRKRKGISCLVQEKTIKDKLTIGRIKKLAIPPHGRVCGYAKKKMATYRQPAWMEKKENNTVIILYGICFAMKPSFIK